MQKYSSLVKKEKKGNGGMIDNKGKLRFLIPELQWWHHERYRNFSDNVILINIYMDNIDSITTKYPRHGEKYQAIMDANGKILFENKEKKWDGTTLFQEGRSFAKGKNGYFLIDKNGKYITDELYDDLFRIEDLYRNSSVEGFKDGKAVVYKDKKWGVIDRMGGYVSESISLEEYGKYNYGKPLKRLGEYILLAGGYDYYYALWAWQSNRIIPLDCNIVYPVRPTDKLIQIERNGLNGYVNWEGKPVWLETKQSEQAQVTKLNINYMDRGYFYASSPPKKKYAGLGGWGHSGNRYYEIQDEQFPPNQLALSLSKEDTIMTEGKLMTHKLYLSNTTKDTMVFNVQDSRLYMNLQAKDKHGIWRDIEYLASSWCGNSYHQLYLPSNHYWSFKFPIYEGRFKTKFRVKLSLERNKRAIYSNEFKGSINPAQFWRIKPYGLYGFMDPYNS